LIMPVRHIDLVSHWQIAAPADRVWDALTEPQTWPQWWPQVSSVRTIANGGGGGLGRIQRIEWRGMLVRSMVIEQEVIESIRPERWRARSQGIWHAESIWLLRSEGGFTNVTYVWRVGLGRPWMQWLEPLLAPLLRWKYTTVMRAGGAGLAGYLGV
jgi:carbon monoxide dehydrogenase subunit G